jgi:predicted CxxxxCH...CXXCH cytochrome family protein
MNLKVYIGIALATLVALCVGCSDLKKETGLTPTTPPLSVHAQGWADSLSPNFHGVVLKGASYNANNCQQCHAKSLQGGTSSVSCYKCHQQYPHSTGWVDTTSTNFHGAALKTLNFNLQSCQACHAANFQGGTSSVSCYTCHKLYPHVAGWTQSSSSAFHGKEIMSEQWSMDGCKTCHGSDYKGVAAKSNVGCMKSGCHVDVNGAQKSPEACNTCHGSFTAPASNIASWAPGKSINGDTLTTARGVGAHQKHLQATMGKAVKCQECHSLPTQVYSAGHLDSGLPAEVVMKDTLANLVTGSGSLVPNPSYNSTQVQCNNTYCHGNWLVRKATAPSDRQYIYADSVITGENYSPKWTGGANEAACGSCHGLPPKGHLQGLSLSSCGGSGCHAGIVDGNGNIINSAKHINGKITIGTTERSF